MAKRKKKFLATLKEGAFTAKAKAHHMSVSAYASAVLSGRIKASTTTKRQANFARNARKWKHK